MRRTIALVLLMLLALPAQAGGFSIEFNAQLPGARFESGTHTVAQAEVPTDMVGQSCVVTLVTTNNESVHDTDLVVSSNGDAVTIADVESQPSVTRTADGTLTLGTSVVVGVTIVGGRGGGSSLSGSVILECQPVTTTTIPSTTTTVPETTTTTVPETTTTVPETTTTVPETTTTVPETTTTVPETTTTTDQTTTVPSTTPSTLPFTGPVADAAVLAGVSAALALVGITLISAFSRND